MIATQTISRIGHDEAMAITAEENARLGRALREMTDDDWARPTGCTSAITVSA